MEQIKSNRTFVSRLNARLLILCLTIFISLSADFRFFYLNNIPILEKLIVIISTILFVAVLVNNYFLSIIQTFFLNPKRSIVLAAAIGLTAALFFLIPYQVVPFRTQHSLVIHVPETSAPVIINQAQNSDNDSVIFAEFQTAEESQNVILEPGQSLNYQRNMTGGMTVTVSAEKSPAEVDVTWDGTTSSHKISSDNSPIKICLSGSSLGVPDKVHLSMLILNFICDIFSCFFLLLILIQLAVLFIFKRANPWNNEIAFFPKIRLAYVLVQFILLLIVRGSMDLPILSTYVPVVVMIFGGILWVYMFLAGKKRRYLLVIYFVFLSLIGIGSNLWLFPNQPDYMTIKLPRLSDNFPDLIKSTGATFTNVISLNYYKQLDQSTMVINEKILSNVDFDAQRFLNINHAKSVKSEDYNFYLTEDQFQEIMKDNRLIPYDYYNQVMHQSGTVYLLEDPQNIDRTYALYQYKVDLFLLPPGTLKEAY